MKELFEEYLYYNKEQGRLYWKKKPAKWINIGMEVGHLNVNDLRYFFLKGEKYSVCRVIWYMHYGEYPMGILMNINGIRDDNRIENLKEIPKPEHRMYTRRRMGENLIGTHYNMYKNKWIAQIYYKGVQTYLGQHDTQLEAHLAYEEFKNKVMR